jgi:hypothetical protein
MFTTSKKSRLAVIITSLGLVACTSQLASAGWAENHPRRAEVNARLEVQNWRINQALSHGKNSFPGGRTARARPVYP